MNEVYKVYRVHVHFRLDGIIGRETYSLNTHCAARAKARVRERFEYETLHLYPKRVRYEVVP